MALTTHLLCAFSLGLLSYAQPEPSENYNSSDLLITCNKISAAISGASQVFFPPTPQYSLDIEHAILSSTQASACSVEPGSAEDVSVILRILGSTRTPFAVKGGGSSTNPGFSSTTGVQIAMTRLNETTVNSNSGTVDVGAGLNWDPVYQALEPTGVNVVGGQVPGVGVAGTTLGGGYSLLSSQYGLTVDNVAGFELVLPNGTVINVTSEDEDLWFGLRGGFNNFGIVTKFTFKSYPQSDVWGGARLYAENQLDAIKEALFKFQQQNDTKANVGLSLTYTSGQLLSTVVFFYDAPTPSGVFDDFLAVNATGGNILTTSFFAHFQSLGPQVSGAFSGGVAFGDTQTASVTQYSPDVFDAFVNLANFWGPRLYALDNTTALDLALEPFDKGLFSHGSGSAYPPDRSQAIFTSQLTVEWTNATLKETMAIALRNISNTIRAVALADGQDVSDAALYPNYALFGTPLEDMYGENVERLRKIRAAIDPEDVMGLTGGWKF
ncbi:FAD-binding domain-containing protein [Russula ochroleuca]|uniref:FAD-binding domain-containing protein n=1 Tax=Russula ochroleuca TaxID=152965 RepID=A0A9P5N4M4_9AGAM|nr:FAD-binding domain-containing protein [Russula ochroleuca]